MAPHDTTPTSGDNRKRTISGDYLELTLSITTSRVVAIPEHGAPPPPEGETSLPRHRRARRNPCIHPSAGKSTTIPLQYPWSGPTRATIRSLDFLRRHRITSIAGDVQCRKCEHRSMLVFDLDQKFGEIASFIAENKALMHHRAPNQWISPAFPSCELCKEESSVRPVIAEKKRSINWLFLLLGQMLGCCTLDQIKYFCKHTKNHRTGAKDRVLYLTYMSLCSQLDPAGPFLV